MMMTVRQVHHQNLPHNISEGFEVTEPRKTIYALSSGRGKAALAVIRISGPAAFQVSLPCYTITPTDSRCLLYLMVNGLGLERSHKGPWVAKPPDKQLRLRDLYHPQTQEMLDHGMVVGFHGPKSFTGEDVVELHVHGGSAIVTGLLDGYLSLSFPATPDLSLISAPFPLIHLQHCHLSKDSPPLNQASFRKGEPAFTLGFSGVYNRLSSGQGVSQWKDGPHTGRGDP